MDCKQLFYVIIAFFRNEVEPSVELEPKGENCNGFGQRNKLFLSRVIHATW